MIIVDKTENAVKVMKKIVLKYVVIGGALALITQRQSTLTRVWIIRTSIHYPLRLVGKGPVAIQ